MDDYPIVKLYKKPRITTSTCWACDKNMMSAGTIAYNEASINNPFQLFTHKCKPKDIQRSDTMMLRGRDSNGRQPLYGQRLQDGTIID